MKNIFYLKNKNIIFVFVLFIGLSAQASHYNGGEITWVCNSVGKYIFTMKIYRECRSGTDFNITETLTIKNYPNVGDNSYTIDMQQISITDISPICYNSPHYEHITCTPQPALNNSGAIQEYIYKSDSIQLDGNPPSGTEGWIFFWEGCCRNESANLVNASSLGYTLRANMYNYYGRIANRCIDNSPQFAEKPLTVIKTGIIETFSNLAYDIDRDSLRYEWARLMDQGLLEIPMAEYNHGYNWNNPLTCHPLINPPTNCTVGNSATTILSSTTGNVSFISYDIGSYDYCVGVKSYKNGALVSEIFRELSMIIVNSVVNTDPYLIIPPADSTNFFQQTANVGDFVEKTFILRDTGLLPAPMQHTYQTMSLTASGMEFGANFTDSINGCPFPPCATLTEPNPIGQHTIQTTFRWQITENHAGNTDKLYYFHFNAKDDYCPAPATNDFIFTVKVLPSSVSVNKNETYSFGIIKSYFDNQTDKFNILYNLANNSKICLEIYNSNGVKIFNYQANQNKGRQEINADLSKLAEGLYIYRLIVNQKQNSGKFIKIND